MPREAVSPMPLGRYVNSPTSTWTFMKKPPRRKLRSACDFCHRSKIRCSGGTPCAKCSTSNMQCHYSYMEQLGKPKGSRNKKTVENAGIGPMTGIGNSTLHHWNGNQSMEAQESADDMQMSQRNCRTEDIPDFRAEEAPDFQASDLLAYLDATGEGDMFDVGTNAPDWNQSDISYNMQSCTGMTAFTANSIEDGTVDPSGTLKAHKLVAHENRQNLPPSRALRQDQLCAAIEGNASETLVAASTQVDVEDWNERSCDCLQNFGNHISRLDHVERQRRVIRLDQSLHNTSLILKSTRGALQCPSCRLNPRVLLLVAMALGTVMSWVHEGCKQQSHDPTLPPAQFGCWRLSHADTLLTRDLLMKRIVTEGQFLVETLRARIEELSCDASKSNIRHGFVEMNTLQKLVCRVNDSVNALAQSITA